jgi:DNA-binding response OmpR family regulator
MEVIHAADVRAALVAISDAPPDLILLDWMLRKRPAPPP